MRDLQFTLVDLKEGAQKQIETNKALIIPMVTNIQMGLETEKRKRGKVKIHTGKNLFRFSKIPKGTPAVRRKKEFFKSN